MKNSISEVDTISKIDETIINVCDKINQELESEGINSNIADNMSALAELISSRTQSGLL